VATDSVSYTYYPASHAWKDRLYTVTDPNGYVTTYEYDLKFVNGVQGTEPCPGRGLVTKIINPDNTYKTFAYDIYGNKIWEENELRERTTYTYDEYNRLRTTTDPLGRTAEKSYGDSANEALAVVSNSPKYEITPSGKKIAITYDADKRVTQKVQAYGSSDARTTKYEYDAVGNMTKTRDQVGGSTGSEIWRDTTFAYDSRNRKITEYAPLSRTTDWNYDSEGNVTWTHFADGTSVTREYGTMNQLIKVTDEMGRSTSYTHHPSGKVHHVIDANGNSYVYDYDASDRPTVFWLTKPDGTGYDYEQMVYDAAGNLHQFRNRSGHWKTINYDSRNRETSTSWDDSVTPSTSTSYDFVSRVTQKSNGTSTLSYTYNAGGQVTREQQAVTGTTTRTLDYEYDADGNRTHLTAQ
jgi:YD repeat-containing protein